jgi:hypothetical protein
MERRKDRRKLVDVPIPVQAAAVSRFLEFANVKVDVGLGEPGGELFGDDELLREGFASGEVAVSACRFVVAVCDNVARDEVPERGDRVS